MKRKYVTHRESVKNQLAVTSDAFWPMLREQEAAKRHEFLSDLEALAHIFNIYLPDPTTTV